MGLHIWASYQTQKRKSGGENPTGCGVKSVLATSKDKNEPTTSIEEIDHSIQGIQKQLQDTNEAPTVARPDIIRACLQSTFFMTVIGAGLKLAASENPANLDFVAAPAVKRLLANHFEADHIIIVLLVTAVVTSARVALLAAWPDYKSATDNSNRQVLPLLSTSDLLVISFLPGFSEELLFRGALVPILGASWLSVLVSGVVFGALHVGGGRNSAFAAWAIVVGWAYGAAYLQTGDLLVPALAHSAANYASAYLWLSNQHDS